MVKKYKIRSFIASNVEDKFKESYQLMSDKYDKWQDDYDEVSCRDCEYDSQIEKQEEQMDKIQDRMDTLEDFMQQYDDWHEEFPEEMSDACEFANDNAIDLHERLAAYTEVELDIDTLKYLISDIEGFNKQGRGLGLKNTITLMKEIASYFKGREVK